jgi:hypothetical protein
VVAGCADAVRTGDRAVAKIELVHLHFSCLQVRARSGLQVFAQLGPASHGHEHV